MAALDEQQVDKLSIVRLDPKLRTPKGKPWQVTFNPSELAFTRTNRFNAQPTPGTSKPKTSYGHGEADRVTIALLFDGTGVAGPAGSVRPVVAKLLDFLKYDGDEHHPPYVRLRWGRWELDCYLKTASVTYTLFARDGEPLRARVSTTFEEVVPEEVRVPKEKRKSPDLYQTWRVVEGETLDAIADAVYGDPAAWRGIAEANGLRNPRALVAGHVLALPAKAG